MSHKQSKRDRKKDKLLKIAKAMTVGKAQTVTDKVYERLTTIHKNTNGRK